MAKIDLKRFKAAGTKPVKVGNNRTAYRPGNGFVHCDLHGHTVARISRDVVYLDTCGYRTATTRAAMQDFLQAATGLHWVVSFADGRFFVGCNALRVDAVSDDDDLQIPIE